MKQTSKILILNPYYNWNITKQLEFTFGKTLIVEDDIKIDELVIKIQKDKIKTLYLVDFMFLNKKLLQKLPKEVVVKSIITFNVASLTFPGILYSFNDIIECYDRRLIHEIGCFDKGLSELLIKSNYNAKHIMLDNNQTVSNKNSKYVGVVSKDLNPNHNYYNALSALALLNMKNVKSELAMHETKRFIKEFGIDLKVTESLKETMANSIINIAPAFTDFYDIYGIISLDSGIPFIYGNTNIFDDNEYLKNILVLKSDDDITELSEKIKNAMENKNNIIKEYKKFRIKYSNLIKKINKGF